MKHACYLLDVNVLVALSWATHTHHAAAIAWFQDQGQHSFATCPLTQLGFTRLAMNAGIVTPPDTLQEASDRLTQITLLPGHRFIKEDSMIPAVLATVSAAVQGYRQITDTYLVALALSNKATLATLDKKIVNYSSAPHWKAGVFAINVL
jgi:uncharacterized protein